jgi:riboflavin transporter FmnP
MSEPNVNAIPTTRATHHSRTHKLTVTAMLSTVAFLLMFIEFPIPALIPAFVKLDISDLPELLAAFSLGPIYGVIVTLLKNVLFSVLHGTSSAYVGELFNFIMGSVFSFTAGFIYQRKKSRKSALTGALVGALLMAVLSVPLNYFVVYPAYVVCYHLPLEAIIGMYQAIRPSTNGLLECLMVFNMPFTFVKGMIDVALCSPRCCTNNIRKELHVHGARLGHSSLDPEQHLLPVSRRRGPQAHDARQRRHHLDPRRRSPAVHKKIPPSGRARADGTSCRTARRKCCAQASRRALAALLA